MNFLISNSSVNKFLQQEANAFFSNFIILNTSIFYYQNPILNQKEILVDEAVIFYVRPEFRRLLMI